MYFKSVENIIPLSKLIGLLFLFYLPLLSILFLKTKRNDLSPPVMGTIFVVIGRAKRAPHWGVQSRFRVIYNVSVICQITWNHVNQTRACSKSVLGGKIRLVTSPYYSFRLYARAALVWTEEKRSLRNEKLKANRAS